MARQEWPMATTASSDSIDYARRREAQERAAAKQARSLAARRAHQELAQIYARLTSPLRDNAFESRH